MTKNFVDSVTEVFSEPLGIYNDFVIVNIPNEFQGNDLVMITYDNKVFKITSQGFVKYKSLKDKLNNTIKNYELGRKSS